VLNGAKCWPHLRCCLSHIAGIVVAGIKKHEIGVICSGIKFIPGVMKIGKFSRKINDDDGDNTHASVCI